MQENTTTALVRHTIPSKAAKPVARLENSDGPARHLKIVEDKNGVRIEPVLEYQTPHFNLTTK